MISRYFVGRMLRTIYRKRRFTFTINGGARGNQTLRLRAPTPTTGESACPDIHLSALKAESGEGGVRTHKTRPGRVILSHLWLPISPPLQIQPRPIRHLRVRLCLTLFNFYSSSSSTSNGLTTAPKASRSPKPDTLPTAA